MRVNALKTYLLANLGLYIAARAVSSGLALTAFDAASIIVQEWAEPTKEKLLYLDPQPDEIEALTNSSRIVTEQVDAYVIVTRGAQPDALANMAEQYLGAIVDCLEHHPDFMEIMSREMYFGVEGNPSAKGARAMIVFKYEE